MGQLFALLFSASYGLSNVFASKALENKEIDKFIGIYITLFVNCLINVTVLIVCTLFGHKVTLNLTGILFFSIAGFVTTFLNRGVFFMAIPYIGVSRAGIFKITSPLFAIIGGVLILEEVIAGKALLGIVVVILGVLYISIETIRTNHTDKSTASNVTNDIISIPKKGIALGLLSGFLLGTGNVLRKLGIVYIPSSILGVSVGSLVAFFSAIIYQVVRGKGKELFHIMDHMNKDYFISGIFSSIGLYSFFIALKHIPLSYANSIGASESLFTMIWSIILFGNKEILTIHSFVGAVIVIIGIILLMLYV